MSLYLNVPIDNPQWTGSLSDAMHTILAPAVRSGVVAPALVWALGAAVLPWLVRGRRFGADAVLAILWAAILSGGIGLAVAAVHGTGVGAPPGAAAGAAAAVLVALAPTVLRRSRRAV